MLPRFFAHMLPVITPAAIFGLRYWVGRGPGPAAPPDDVKLSLAWSLLSVCFSIVTMQWALGKPALCSGRIEAYRLPRWLFTVEKGAGIVLLLFLVVSCGMTNNPQCAQPVFVACVGILGVLTFYLCLGFAVAESLA